MSFLNSTYPLNLKGNWKIAALTGLFISFFMYLFQPYGLSFVETSYKSAILIGYGPIVFVVLFIDIVILPKLLTSIFKTSEWTNGKHFLFFIWIFFTIGLGNFIYSSIAFSFPLNNFKYFLIFEGFTVGVGIIPVFFIILYSHNIFLKTNLKTARQLTENLPENINDKLLNNNVICIFSSYNGKDSIHLEENSIIFIESDGNYCSIYYIYENQIKKKILRNTLKNIELMLPGNSSLFKSHRAFIINLKHIFKIIGNAQGYRILFNKLSKEASVSRQYIKKFKELIQNKV